MGFQTNVRIGQGGATLGEVRFGSPMSADPKIILSTAAANNVIGRAVQVIAASDLGVTADLGSAGIFAGILIHPKSYSLQGTSEGTLESSVTLRNNENIEVLTMGTMTVAITSAGNIGDEIYFNFNTGVLLAQAPGGSAPADHARVPGGFVVRQNIPAPSGSATEVLAYIKVGAVA